MKNFNTNTAGNDEWLTPPHIINALGPFYLDPCAPVIRPWDTAEYHYSKGDNGLSLPWSGRVWLNPPYGRETFRWLDRMSQHGDGLALIFARTETVGFHEQVWNKAHSVFFFKGRLRFHHVDGTQAGTANAPSCLVSYSEEDTHSIMDAVQNGNIKGRLVTMEHEP